MKSAQSARAVIATRHMEGSGQMTGNRTRWIGLALVGLAVGCQHSPTNEEASAQQSTPVEAAVAAAPVQSGSSSAAPVHAASLTLVTDRSLVCMVNNQFMGQPQIPIEVDGRTYYGCCEMCKGRLRSDPTSRMSTDPVSGRAVDKATAVIGRRSDGRTLYFEDSQTFAAYARQPSQ
jgi:YHS domain-containing protein